MEIPAGLTYCRKCGRTVIDDELAARQLADRAASNAS
jgi:hypothetical protein